MKKTLLPIFMIALFSLFFATSAQAQLPATNIETLILDIWPDYDEPSVLILMTGTLPPETPLPATVTIPISEDAQINAVARITSENQMLDDIQYIAENGLLTFTTPDPRFRIEYYAPYESNGSTHTFSFDWLSDMPVEGILAAVQQPSGATNMNVIPASANVVTDTTDGFTYYTYPPNSIAAGEPFNITFNYEMTTPQLSIDSLPAVNPAPESNPNSSSSANTSTPSSSSNSFALDNVNWPLVIGLLGIVLVAVVVTWLVATRQTQPARTTRKPRPKRANTPVKPAGKVRFCHECGNELNGNDKFCRECGTAVKGTNH